MLNDREDDTRAITGRGSYKLADHAVWPWKDEPRNSFRFLTWMALIMAERGDSNHSRSELPRAARTCIASLTQIIRTI